MPPFVNTQCTNCSKPNRFDLAELRKEDGSLVKGVDYRVDKSDEKFVVICQHCGRKFTFTVKGGNNDKT